MRTVLQCSQGVMGLGAISAETSSLSAHVTSVVWLRLQARFLLKQHHGTITFGCL